MAFGRKATSDVSATDATIADGTIERPRGRLIWVLAETKIAAAPAPVIAEELSVLIEDAVHVLVTAAGSEPLPATVAARVIAQKVPRDDSEAVHAFLDHWKPDFGVVIGTPDTPLLLKTAAKQMPLYHALPGPDADGVRRYPAYLGAFRACLVPSAIEAKAMRHQLKNPKASIEVIGPLSDTVRALPCNDAECDDLARLLGGRPVWLAASIDSDEVSMIETAHRRAFRSAHRLLLLLVPRDPTAGNKIAEVLEADVWQVGLRSRGDEPDPDIQIYVADTDDEMGLWYRLAPSTFIGGTFTPNSLATDPFDAAALGSAVLHGPHIGKSPARFERLDDQGASILVSNAEELGEAVIALLAPDKAAILAQAGWASTTESADVIERLVSLMQAELEAREATL